MVKSKKRSKNNTSKVNKQAKDTTLPKNEVQENLDEETDLNQTSATPKNVVTQEENMDEESKQNEADPNSLMTKKENLGQQSQQKESSHSKNNNRESNVYSVRHFYNQNRWNPKDTSTTGKNTERPGSSKNSSSHSKRELFKISPTDQEPGDNRTDSWCDMVSQEENLDADGGETTSETMVTQEKQSNDTKHSRTGESSRDSSRNKKDYTYSGRSGHSFDSRKSEPNRRNNRDRDFDRNDRKRNSYADVGFNKKMRDDSNSRKNPRYSWDKRRDSEFELYNVEFNAHGGNVQFSKVEEINGNLFEMPKTYSLAHCVAEDLNMGSGIAVQFRRDFKHVDELLNQRQPTGGLAILEDKERYIYYLVTKRFSAGKPTYATLFSSLKTLRQHIIDHKVKQLAMPRIGCGLDRLEWPNVKFMVEFLFKKVDVQIVVCNLELTEDSPQQRSRNCRVTNETYPIQDIEKGTAIIYFSSEDGEISEEMNKLDEKIPFLREFRIARKSMGNVILYTKDKDYLMCGCIIRKNKSDPFDFGALKNCVSALQKQNKNLDYYYFAFQAFRDKSDPIISHKIINVLRNSLRDVEIYVCWPGDLQDDILPKDRFSDSFNKDQEKYKGHRSGYGEGSFSGNWRSRNDQSQVESELDKTSSSINENENENASFNSITSTPGAFSETSVDYWNPDEVQSSTSGVHTEPSEVKITSQLNPEIPSFTPKEHILSSTENQIKPNAEKSQSKSNYEVYQTELKSNKITCASIKEQTMPNLPNNCSRVCFAGENLIIESGVPTGPDISKQIGKMLSQNHKQGGLAFIKEENNYFYCLVVNKPNESPTGENIFSALEQLYDHAKKNFVKKLIIPKMDSHETSSFEWSELKYMLSFVFSKSSIEIILAPFDPLYNESALNSKNKNNLTHVRNPIHHMKKKSVVLYLASADGHFTPEMKGLAKKFSFDEAFQKMKRSVGDVARHKENEDHVLYGCIVKKGEADDINFESLQKCLLRVNDENKEKLKLAGIQAVDSEDQTVNFKIATVLLNSLQDITINMCWPGTLRDKIPTNHK